MSDFCFTASLSALHTSECFRDATVDELRVLLTLLSLERRITNEDEISTLSGVSRARVLSAITLWREAGVITELDAFAELSDEFSAPKGEDSSETVAKDIRDEGLRELIEECAATLGREALSAEEIREIHHLYMDKSLSPEYIVTLAAYMQSKQKPGVNVTPRKLAREAERLSGRGIETLEELELFIDRRARTSDDEWEFRRTLGIYKRNLSDSEREYIRRWYGEFSFSSAIIGEAFSIVTKDSSDSVNLPYMDAILEAWHKSGCKTVAECKKQSLLHREELRTKREETKKPRAKREESAEVPKFSNFNSEDALMSALIRSYGENKD